jgi:hypothetical protein
VWVWRGEARRGIGFIWDFVGVFVGSFTSLLVLFSGYVLFVVEFFVRLFDGF